MSAGAPATVQGTFSAERLLSGAAGRLGRLGLTVSFWDPTGEAVIPASASGEFCRNLCRQDLALRSAAGQLAQKVCAQGRSEVTSSGNGCALLAVPVHRRRRLAGAVVACLPTLETPDSEEFARACGRGRLDRQLMARLCRQVARHSSPQCPLLVEVLEWLIQDQQAKEVAGEELATLSTNLADTYEELALLYRISGSIKITQSTTEFFQNLCRELLEVMQVQAASAVLYPRQPGGQAEEMVWAGALPLTGEQWLQVVRRYLAPRLGGGGKAMIDNQFSLRAAHLGPKVSGITTLIAVPLVGAERSKGVLVAINKSAGQFDSVDLKLASSVGGQAAVFLENHHLYEDLQDLLMGVLHALTASIDAKDTYTCGHSRRVALISRRLAQLCSFDDRHVERVYLAGLLHDIGKIGISEAVLRKTGRLTEQEYDGVRRHPAVGAAILGGIRQMQDLIPAIRHHHERLDGRGYPGGLSGNQIPTEALIVGLADCFDAMTSYRTYRDCMPLEAVMAELRRCSGTQLDGRLVERLLSLNLEAFLADLRESAGAAEDKAP